MIHAVVIIIIIVSSIIISISASSVSAIIHRIFLMSVIHVSCIDMCTVVPLARTMQTASARVRVGRPVLLHPWQLRLARDQRFDDPNSAPAYLVPRLMDSSSSRQTYVSGLHKLKKFLKLLARKQLGTRRAKYPFSQCRPMAQVGIRSGYDADMLRCTCSYE